MYEQQLQEVSVLKMKYIALIVALVMTLATQAAAECGELCDLDCWKAGKTTADVQAELDAGVDVNVRMM